jgi:hypothetical protein
MSEKIVTARMEERGKEEDSRIEGLMRLKRTGDKGSKQFAYGGRRLEGLEEDCVGRRGPQRTALHETKKED